MAVSQTSLDDVLRRYGESQEPVNDLAEEAGLNPIAFVRLARERGYPTREERKLAERAAAAIGQPARKRTKSKPKSKAKVKTGHAATARAKPQTTVSPKIADGEKTAPPATGGKLAVKPAARARPLALLQRVYNTIDGELTKLEAQTGVSSQDRERASRALSQMVSSLEKATEMQREISKDKNRGGGAKAKEALRHAEDLRRQIAERLERLRLKQPAAKSPE